MLFVRHYPLRGYFSASGTDSGTTLSGGDDKFAKGVYLTTDWEDSFTLARAKFTGHGFDLGVGGTGIGANVQVYGLRATGVASGITASGAAHGLTLSFSHTGFAYTRTKNTVTSTSATHGTHKTFLKTGINKSFSKNTQSEMVESKYKGDYRLTETHPPKLEVNVTWAAKKDSLESPDLQGAWIGLNTETLSKLDNEKQTAIEGSKEFVDAKPYLEKLEEWVGEMNMPIPGYPADFQGMPLQANGRDLAFAKTHNATVRLNLTRGAVQVFHFYSKNFRSFFFGGRTAYIFGASRDVYLAKRAAIVEDDSLLVRGTSIHHYQCLAPRTIASAAGGPLGRDPAQSSAAIYRYEGTMRMEQVVMQGEALQRKQIFQMRGSAEGPYLMSMRSPNISIATGPLGLANDPLANEFPPATPRISLLEADQCMSFTGGTISSSSTQDTTIRAATTVGINADTRVTIGSPNVVIGALVVINNSFVNVPTKAEVADDIWDSHLPEIPEEGGVVAKPRWQAFLSIDG